MGERSERGRERGEEGRAEGLVKYFMGEKDMEKKQRYPHNRESKPFQRCHISKMKHSIIMWDDEHFAL